VLGTSGGPLALLTDRLDVPRDNATAALGYLLPPIVGLLTPGGDPSAALPPQAAGAAATGANLLAAPPAPEPVSRVLKWFPWVMLVLAALIIAGYYLLR
jgi:hypothetical protein